MTSWEEFLELPDRSDGARARALIDGEVVWFDPPSMFHQELCLRLAVALRQWASLDPGRGTAVTSPLVRVEERPLGYVGDVGLYPAVRLGRDERGRPVPIDAPIIAIEVRSPSNRTGPLKKKVGHHRLAGVLEVWSVDPDAETVIISDGVIPRICGDVITSPLLEGFSLAVDELFAP